MSGSLSVLQNDEQNLKSAAKKIGRGPEPLIEESGSSQFAQLHSHISSRIGDGGSRRGRPEGVVWQVGKVRLVAFVDMAS